MTRRTLIEPSPRPEEEIRRAALLEEPNEGTPEVILELLLERDTRITAVSAALEEHEVDRVRDLRAPWRESGSLSVLSSRTSLEDMHRLDEPELPATGELLEGSLQELEERLAQASWEERGAALLQALNARETMAVPVGPIPLFEFGQRSDALVEETAEAVAGMMD